MANIFQTTNYPTSFLEGTFGDKFYQNVVEPFRAGKGRKPTLGQVAKNWNPLKAFTPKMLATGPTRAASTFLKGTGIGALTGILTPTRLGADDMPTGDAEQEYYDYYTKYGDIGEYANLKIPGIRRRKMMMDKRATEQGIAQVAMQKRIQEEEKQRAAAKAKAAAAAAAASSPYSGQGAQGGGGGSNIGGGQQTSRGPVGGAVTHSQARDARGGMSGWGLSRGGLASLYG